MTNIKDLKFTIEPEETSEIELFANSDNKEIRTNTEENTLNK